MKQWVWVVLIAVTAFAGGALTAWWQFGQDRPDPVVPDLIQNQALERVVAQARLQPRGGTLNVIGPPGSRLTELFVHEGTEVTGGQTELAQLTGQAVLEKQVELTSARRQDAELELEQRQSQAALQVRSAELQLQTAELSLEQLKDQSDLAIERQKLAQQQAKLDRLARLAEDPDTRSLVSPQGLADQQLALDEARVALSRAEQNLARSHESLTLAVSAAEANLESARNAHQAVTRALQENRSASVAQELAEIQARESILLAPISGTVLKVFMKPGEAITNLPILQLGDLSQMECIAEVNETLVSRVQPGQRVQIRSGALSRSLSGTVRSVSRVVGTPSIRDPNPLAMVDRRAVEVLIDLDASDWEIARNFVNLQVAVEITTDGPPFPDASSLPKQEAGGS